ncbi:leucine-rich repeat serine/threonine-protein kinase 1-like isoform X2 [Physella acuta]|uniref:leucine-rich repeat serine/threonine-protein kinase 1-like isoform X2 n=1 Tax=Physella acuta TaxID=109671 RepID=UPI0027DCA7A1|nr:leucine-rich repeat serine/threonine-protein kinase 1-like isoform X2 [Physella acuta]
MAANDDSWPGQLIHQAAIYNNVDLLQCLLQGEEKKNINAQDVCGRTALYTAVSNGSVQCLELLLDNGADINIPAGARCHNMTPLHEAVLDSKLDALAILLARGADMTSMDVSGKTPLALAKYMKNREAIDIIEREKEKKKGLLDQLSTELCEACAEGKLEEVKRILEQSGPNRKHVINMTTKGLSPLGIASKCGYAEILKVLLEEGANCTCQKDTGLTLLHLACESGNIEVMKVLLQTHPDLMHVRSVEHQLPLHSAVVSNKIEAVQFLLDYTYPAGHLLTFTDSVTSLIYQTGIDVNAQDAMGETALHIACRNGHLEIVRLLMNYVIKVEIEKDMQKSQSLMCDLDTSFDEDELNASADSSEEDYSPNQPNPPPLRGNRTKKSHHTIHPVDMNILNSDGLSSFHMAIRHKRVEVLKVLLNCRKPPANKLKIKDIEMSVLMFAYEQGSVDVLRILLSNGLRDEDDKVLNSAFFSQDHTVKWLLLSHKSSKDQGLGRNINKTEMKRLAYQISQRHEENLTSIDPEFRFRYPTVPVAIMWEGLGVLDRMDTSCLVSSCYLHNPSMNKNLEMALCLCAITKVDISKNSFEKFPVVLLELPSLVYLKASRNQIEEIPEDYTILSSSLEELHLNENKLKSLPKFIFQLPQLKFLDVAVNKLKELPVEVWDAPSLVSLNLSKNCLSELPSLTRESIVARQGGFRSPRLSHNSPHRPSFSSSVGSFDTESYQLDVGEDDFIMVAPNALIENQVMRVNKWGLGITVEDRDPWKGSNSQPSGLKQLWLSTNKFTEIPSCLICCAPNLEVLVMSENPLTSIGNITDYPPFLIELDLSKTNLTTMDPWKHPVDLFQDWSCFAPNNISSFNKYSSMTMNGNSPNASKLTRRSSSNSSFRNRRRASPSPSTRDSLFVPCLHRSHTTLAKLEKLNLAGNRLTSVILTRDACRDGDTRSTCSMESEEIQSRLLFPHIVELNLSSNHLSSLPPDIGELSSLKILSLTRNIKLKELPPKLGLLKSLWKLELDFCPLDGAIQDFLLNSRFPVKDILGFLQSVLEESTEYNCMNLMLVGFHKIGKTTLLQKLGEKGKVRSKATHWRDRVNREELRKQGTLLSTVGIDINELVLERRTKGSVVFRTWDFGGQREYYATHQYFLSPRSLYLVVWSIIEGERGVENLLQWLVNIQARAPGASVIIVGTHLDILRDRSTRRNYPDDFEASMMTLINKLFIDNQEPDKSGLPNILRAINVSCTTGENIKLLVDVIYDTVFELKHPRSKTQNLVRQKIPRKYLLLQTIIRELAVERIKDCKEPVLNRSKYTLCVQNKMMEHGMTFRDVEELEQATRFLHENGVLFHYDDLPLRDLFFLDPQWLCDQLAKVITVKEINNFAQRGVMRLSNLEFLFKSNTFQPEHIKVYITSLLNKFEVALQFDEEHLLLPSLLPTETELLEMARRKSDVRIPLRKPTESSVGLSREDATSDRTVDPLRSSRSGRRLVEGPPSVLHVGSSIFYAGSQANRETVTLSSLRDSSKLLLLAIKPTSNPIFSCCRLYFLTYFPSGFWPRLITRVLADGSIYQIVKELFPLPPDLIRRSPEVKSLSDRDPEWRCWQSGFELFYLGFEMLRIREVFFSTSSYFCDYSKCRIKCSIDNEWSYLDVLNSKILEITFPTDSLRFHVTTKDGPPLQNLDLSKPSSTVYREEVSTTKLLVKIVEHVDNLLQDWYPDIGELRFNQNCEGRYLVTRIVPCPQCLNREVTRQRSFQADQNSWYFLNPEVPDLCMPVLLLDNHQPVRDRSATVIGATRHSADEAHITAPVTTRPRTLTEGQAFIYNKGSPDGEEVIFSWLVERCMLDVLEGVDAMCPRHGSISPLYLMGKDGVTHQLFIAPDVVFQDQSQNLLLPSSTQLDIGSCLGKGNFGEVHEGWLYRKDNCGPDHVAVKILFRQVQARKDITKGFHSYLEKACSAYLTARQEVSILSQLEHPHIVPLMALCLKPLSLVLTLAPQGALDTRLKLMHKHGECFPFFVIREIVIQVSSALSYLHSVNIIYRDLKAENVLIWELPASDAQPRSPIQLKLADYGISRYVLPTGAKGFGGTPPFIAPEILQHAGKGTYTTKVDVFSFGMFLFEVLTCRAPFNNVNNPNNLICQGERPSLTVQEAEQYPSYMMDLISLCWSQDPEDRPTMEAILGIARSPQFCHMHDVVSLGMDMSVYSGCVVTPVSPTPGTASPIILGPSDHPTSASQTEMTQIWLSSSFHGKSGIEIFTFNQARKVENYKTLSPAGPPIVAMCVYDCCVWSVNSKGLIQIFHSEQLQLVHQLELPVPATVPLVNFLALHPLPQQHCVLAISAEGTIYMCKEISQGYLLDDQSVTIHKVEPCFSSVLVNTAERCELWLGQCKGAMCVWNIESQTLDYCLSHGPRVATATSSVAFLVTLSGTSADCSNVWSYNYPGSIICMWDTRNRCIAKKLDCSQIVSTVDSPVLATSEHFECGQVSALSAIDHYLYIGTTRGSMLITEATTLIPLCLFQCHTAQDFYIKVILPVKPVSTESEAEDAADRKDGRENVKNSVPAVVSVGKGYTNIIKTFHPTLDSGPANKLDDVRPHNDAAAHIDPYGNHTFLLVWNATDWEFY